MTQDIPTHDLRLWAKDTRRLMLLALEDEEGLVLEAAAKRLLEATRAAALEEAAGVLDAEVKRHRDQDAEFEKHRTDSGLPPREPHWQHFCEDYGCTSLEEYAKAIRALANPEDKG